ncbi:MAG: CopG family transcriptional regulator [Desulfamplus sp.]|nr:CopG family transcriptional regulator [Desulfamplus sp.]
MIQTALLRFKKELELENLRQSADSYSEIYNKDSELIDLTESAIEDIEDLAAFEERADEPLISYEQIIKRLNKDGRI